MDQAFMELLGLLLQDSLCAGLRRFNPTSPVIKTKTMAQRAQNPQLTYQQLAIPKP